ncbi:cytosine permease [Streptomyces erythrochromogenes]|uniref:cytosine permease n=1 Tax=Streptomyces erythrochromogenes TaxID=285574 RepID=UPI0037F1FD1C
MLRRGRYDGVALSDETPRSPYWYTGGINWSGAVAALTGVAAAALCVDTLYAGPIAALGGVDLSLPVGMAVAAVLYAASMRRSRTVLASRAQA